MLFGEFLIQQGYINREALEEALESQARDRVLLGQLAVQEGYLTNKDLFSILKIQRGQQETTKRIGEIAIELQLMTEETLIKLLTKQAEGKELLGNIMVSKGSLAPLKLVKALKGHQEIKQAK